MIHDGEARNKDNITIIKKLLTKCGKQFRSLEKLFDHIENIEVSFELIALKKHMLDTEEQVKTLKHDYYLWVW